MFIFFNDTATTEIYTLSLHDALPIYKQIASRLYVSPRTVSGHLYRIFPKLGISTRAALRDALSRTLPPAARSEEHTSELQSRQYLVCRLLLEKKKNTY